MSARLRPLPQHGERACYLRGCRRPECSDANYRYMTRYRYDRANGRSRCVPVAAVYDRVRELHETGWTAIQIATAAKSSEAVIGRILRNPHGTVSAGTAARIMAAQPSLDTCPDKTCVPAVGTVRRIQALRALGYTLHHITDKAGLYRTALCQVLDGNRPTVTVAKARAITRCYDELSRTPGPSKWLREAAKARGWAPPAAWDDESIEDPDAHPDWTGYCGTDRGWHVHKLEDLPMCTPCETAHQAWLDERTSDGWQRVKDLFAARAHAVTRGADLAEDARELLRLDCTHEAAAERLGVTVNHLYQVLKRHPAPATRVYEEAS